MRRARNKKKTGRTYSWVPGSRFGREYDASRIGPEVERLVKAYGQNLAIEEAVREAENPLNPLHPVIFREDDETAAYERRLDLARHLFRSVQVTIITPERKEVTMRVVVTHERPNQPGKNYYSTTEYALADPSLRAEVLKKVLMELAAIRRKYSELDELAKVFTEIDQALRKAA
jgi:hypothetical protein